MKRCMTAILLLLILAICAGTGCAEEYVPTADWEPPVIDVEDAKANAPYLLVLKVAQEEIGYIEGPHEDESKYGEWYALLSDEESGEMIRKYLGFDRLDDEFEWFIS